MKKRREGQRLDETDVRGGEEIPWLRCVGIDDGVAGAGTEAGAGAGAGV